MKLLHEFEEWLQGENTKLTKICAATSSSTAEIKARQSKLEVGFQGLKEKTKIAVSTNYFIIKRKKSPK